jgi:hypothetical protein
LPRSSHPRSISVRALALVAVVTASVAVAQAQPKPDPANPDVLVAYKLEVEQGTSAFRAGMYSDARVSFERAYSLYAEPVLLFNIASCYRRAGDAENAIAAYRRFIDAAPAGDHRIALATQTITTLEQELAKSAADDDVEVQVSDGDDADEGKTFVIPNGKPTAASLWPPAEPAPITAPLAETAAPAPAPRRSRLRAYGLGIASAGGIMLIGAAVDGYRSHAIAGELEALPREHQWNNEDAARYRAGESAAFRSRVLAISGAAVVAAGATVYVIGKRRDANAPRIEGAVGPGGGQVVLRGSF